MSNVMPRTEFIAVTLRALGYDAVCEWGEPNHALLQRVSAIQQPVFGNGTIRSVDSTATIEVNDLLAFFFRRQFACGGNGRLFGGFTRHSQGLVGGDAIAPISPNWSLRSSFMYVAPGGDNSTTDPSFSRESWNVGVSLVWTPCGRNNGCGNYSRPLFNVADNGTFITRFK